MDSDLKAMLLFAGGFILLCGLITGGIVWGGVAYSDYQCRSQWPASYQPKWSFSTDCTIMVKGERVPASNYRVL